jgi:hypothetical protein
MANLQLSFNTHSSWSDLNNENSEFYQFIDKFLKHEQGKLSVFKLKCLSILWCEGKPIEKSMELFNLLQGEAKKKIAANDIDILKSFTQLLDVATEMVFDLEPIYMGTERVIMMDTIETVKAEKYEDLLDSFLDDVFGLESTLSREEFEKEAAKKAAWIFDPNQIRKKLEYI